MEHKNSVTNALEENFNDWDIPDITEGSTISPPNAASPIKSIYQKTGEAQVVVWMGILDEKSFTTVGDTNNTLFSFKTPAKALELDFYVRGGVRFSGLDQQEKAIPDYIETIERERPDLGHLSFDNNKGEIHHLRLEVYPLPEEDPEGSYVAIDNLKLRP